MNRCCGLRFYHARQCVVDAAGELELKFNDGASQKGNCCPCGDEASGVADVANLSAKELAGTGRDAFSEACADDPDAASTVTI